MSKSVSGNLKAEISFAEREISSNGSTISNVGSVSANSDLTYSENAGSGTRLNCNAVFVKRFTLAPEQSEEFDLSDLQETILEDAVKTVDFTGGDVRGLLIVNHNDSPEQAVRIAATGANPADFLFNGSGSYDLQASAGQNWQNPLEGWEITASNVIFSVTSICPSADIECSVAIIGMSG